MKHLQPDAGLPSMCFVQTTVLEAD